MDMLTLSHHRLGDVTVIEVGGELDIATAGLLDAYIRDVRRASGDRLVLDLSGTTFMASQGVRVLLAAYAHARTHGGTVHLAALRPEPACVVHLTCADAWLPVHGTVREAVAAAGSEALTAA